MYHSDTYNALDALKDHTTLRMKMAEIAEVPTENQLDVHDMLLDTDHDYEMSVLIHSVEEPEDSFCSDCGERLLIDGSMHAWPLMWT